MSGVLRSPLQVMRLSRGELLACGLIGLVTGPLLGASLWLIALWRDLPPLAWLESPSATIQQLAIYTLAMVGVMLISAWRQRADVERGPGAAFEVPLSFLIVAVFVFFGDTGPEPTLKALRLLCALAWITAGSLLIKPASRRLSAR